MWGIVADANRTAAGAESLEAVIQVSNTPVTIETFCGRHEAECAP